jgi:hypothetical protein
MRLITAGNGGSAMTGTTDIKATARRVLEEIFPADDEAALMRQLTTPVPEPADQAAAAVGY